MMEMLDIFDAKMNLIGKASRDDVHQQGYWHQTFHCWIICNEQGKNYVLFQIRDKEKSVAPNKLDITAAGHLLSGETKEDGIRELEEELGLTVDYNKLFYLGTRITASESVNQINKEFAQVYLLYNETPIEQYVLQDGEVAGLVQIEVNDGLRLCSGETESVFCRAIRKIDGNSVVEDVEVRFEQFIPRIDSYYYKIFIMAERYFQGSRYLAI